MSAILRSLCEYLIQGEKNEIWTMVASSDVRNYLFKVEV